MQTYVSNNKLVVKYKDNTRVNSYEVVRVEIAAPEWNSLHLSGAGNVYVNGSFTPGSLDLDTSYSGDMNPAELNAGYLDANISGSDNSRVSQGAATDGDTDSRDYLCQSFYLYSKG